MALTELANMKKKMNTRPILKLIDLEDIEFNELNKFDIKDIEELKANISQYGLLKPLEVYLLDSGKYMLLGGHRRLRALTELFSEELVEAEIPCMIYQKPQETEGDVNERLQIIISNGQRDMGIGEKIKVTKELLDILKIDPTKKAIGVPTRDWIAGFLGCSPRSAQKYMNATLGKPTIKKELISKENKQTSKNDENLYLNKVVKFLEKYNEQVNTIFWSLADKDKKKVVDVLHGEDITVEKMLTKLASITDLYVKSLKSLER